MKNAIIERGVSGAEQGIFDITSQAKILQAVAAIRAAKERLMLSEIHQQMQEMRLNAIQKEGVE